MKINIEIDITPEEFRKLMGWPDVRGFQDELLDHLRQQMRAGAEGYDPISLMKPFMTQAAGTMDAFQKMVGGMIQNYGQGEEKAPDQPEDKS